MTEQELLAKIKTWKQTNNPKIFEEIYPEFELIVKKNTHRFAGGGLPNETIELQGRNLVAQALRSYEPTKGNVYGYVNSNLQGISRFVNTYQSPLRLPENLNLKYNTYEAAHNELEAKLDRPPSTIELAEYLSWPVTKVDTFKRRRVTHEDETGAVVGKIYDNQELNYLEFREYVASKYGADADSMFAHYKGWESPAMSIADISRKYNMDYYSARKLINQLEQELNDFIL